MGAATALLPVNKSSSGHRPRRKELKNRGGEDNRNDAHFLLLFPQSIPNGAGFPCTDGLLNWQQQRVFLTKKTAGLLFSHTKKRQ